MNKPSVITGATMKDPSKQIEAKQIETRSMTLLNHEKVFMPSSIPKETFDPSSAKRQKSKTYNPWKSPTDQKHLPRSHKATRTYMDYSPHHPGGSPLLTPREGYSCTSLHPPPKNGPKKPGTPPPRLSPVLARRTSTASSLGATAPTARPGDRTGHGERRHRARAGVNDGVVLRGQRFGSRNG